MKKKLLIYPASYQEKALAIKDVLCDYDVTILEEDALEQSIGYLFELPEFTKNTNKDTHNFTFDMMILPVIEHEDIQKLSQTLKERNLNVERKAMLTQHNQHWTLAALLKEVDEEHTYFAKRDELSKLVQTLMKLDPSTLPEKEASAFKKMIVDAYDVLQDQNSVTNDFIKHYDLLNKSFKNYIKK